MGGIRYTRLGNALGFQITTQTANDLVEAGERSGLLGISGYAKWTPDGRGGVNWQMVLQQPNAADEQGEVTDRIIIEGGTAKIYDNADFPKLFTGPEPLIWDAIVTPPTVTVASDGTATLSFPQPTSANRPFTYTTNQTNTTTGVTAQASIGPGGPQTDRSGNVSIPIVSLIEGNEYTWQVIVDTQYDGVSATSATTASATAIGTGAG